MSTPSIPINTSPPEKTSLRLNGLEGAAALPGEGERAVPKSWQPASPEALAAHGSEKPFYVKPADGRANPVLVVRNQHGQILDTKTRHLLAFDIEGVEKVSKE